MSKKDHAVSEVQLKARKTSLGKKTKEELITIILRKDKSERKMNKKIQELTYLLREANKLNEEKATRISNFIEEVADLKDLIEVKQSQIDALLQDKNTLQANVDSLTNRYNRIERFAKTRKNVIYVLSGIIITMIFSIIGTCVF